MSPAWCHPQRVHTVGTGNPHQETLVAAELAHEDGQQEQPEGDSHTLSAQVGVRMEVAKIEVSSETDVWRVFGE